MIQEKEYRHLPTYYQEKWEKIEKLLNQIINKIHPIKNYNDLLEIIIQIQNNGKNEKKENNSLPKLEEFIEKYRIENDLEEKMRKIAQLALKMNQLFPEKKLKKLKKPNNGERETIELSYQQIGTKNKKK